MAASRAVLIPMTGIAGIDYSISCPALAILPDSKPFLFENVKFFFTTEKKKYAGGFETQFTGILQPADYLNNAERFAFNGTTFATLCSDHGVSECGIEDYAFAAKGLVFQIGEHTGVLKHMLWQKSIQLKYHSPMSLKKLATGKGNAKKPDMHAAFVAETGVDLTQVFGTKKADVSPVSDLVDAYFCLKATVLGIDQ